MIQFPPPGDTPAPSRFESWFVLFTSFWIFLGIVLLLLPRKYGNALIKAAFPWAPTNLDKGNDNEK
jgi:hypothetical protein